MTDKYTPFAAEGLILDIDLSGIDETAANIDGLPADLEMNLTITMNKSLSLLQAEVSARTPVDRDKLRDGINYQFISPFPELVGSVGSGAAEYAPAIEHGRKPGRMPPVDAIKFWVIRKLQIPEEKAEGVAWAIAKSIAKRGFSPEGDVGPKGAKMFEEGLKASEQYIIQLFDSAVGRATAKANDST